MKLTINGEEEELEFKDEANILDLLKAKDVKMPEAVSVQYNDKLLKRKEYDSTKIKEGDIIEFIYYMGGGL